MSYNCASSLPTPTLTFSLTYKGTLSESWRKLNFPFSRSLCSWMREKGLNGKQPKEDIKHYKGKMRLLMKHTRDCLGGGQMSEACGITRSGVLKMYSDVNSCHIRFAWRPQSKQHGSSKCRAGQDNPMT